MLMAAFSAASYGLSATYTYNEVEVAAKAADGEESKTITGTSFTYNQATGVLTPTQTFQYGGISFDLTLNWNLSSPVDLIYVNCTDNTDWGMALTGSNQMTQRWKDKYDSSSGWTGYTTINSSTVLNGVTTGATSAKFTAKLDNEGTYLKHAASSTWDVYDNSGLKSSTTTLKEVYVNTDYITTLYVRESIANVTYASQTWSKTYTPDTHISAINGQITFDGNGSDKAPLWEGVAVDATKDIVIGGKGSLFLQEWNKNNIYLKNDIYLASRENNAEAIHFGSDSGSYTTTLAGNIYLVEDAHIKSRGTDAINITGTVTDKNVSGSTETNGGYKLLVAGEGYNFKGDVNVTTLEFAETQGIHSYTRSTKATFEKGFLVDNLIMNAGNEISSAVALTSIKTLTVNGAAKLSSVLDLSSATTLTLNHALDLDNHKLTLGALTLSGSLIADLDATLENTGFVTLFTGVSELLVGNVATASTEFTPIAAETVFTNLSEGAYLLNLENGAVKLTAAPAIPEPTTATLSLLALAGLAARRRRK